MPSNGYVVGFLNEVTCMSSVEDRLNSSNFVPGQPPKSGPLRMPGLVSQYSPAPQNPFPDDAAQPSTSALVSDQLLSSGDTRPLTNTLMSSGVTRNLPDVQTGALPPLRSTTSALREPLLIRSTGKKSSGTLRAPQGRRWVIHISATIMLILLGVVTLLAVAPAGKADQSSPNFFQSFMNWSQGNNNNPSLLAQQAATVTAVTQDGYQPPTQENLPSLPKAPSGVSTYDDFTFGQCTYWADYYYHELSGNWVPWSGDAWEWANGARAYGWNVSSTPHFPSIIVLQPGVQGASGYGHVAIATGFSGSGVMTSNMNWYAGGGGWDRVSNWVFYPGAGVLFVWK
jgi:surface antigen